MCTICRAFLRLVTSRPEPHLFIQKRPKRGLASFRKQNHNFESFLTQPLTDAWAKPTCSGQQQFAFHIPITYWIQ